MGEPANPAKAIFLEAIEKYTPDEWPAFLDEACGDDPHLQSRVKQLLKARSLLGAFQENAQSTLEAPIGQTVCELTGTVIGPYKLLQQIGEGGMGTVYMAEQTRPVQRKVALKIIKPGMDSRQVIARFEAERQALALMDHVNIARVLDAGTTEAGLPYFVMELVHGVPITKYCDDNHLTPRERLQLFVPVCQAIQHAHQKGIIHRDIKPTNVMITLYDGKPVPKVIDFGVAKATEQKLTERTLFTQYGAMVGTLEYMSPEQAEMSALGIDTRSDIYSLGVLLYELLTGSTPLNHKRMKEAGYVEILRMIKEEEPPRPSTRLSASGESLSSISVQRKTEPLKLVKLMRGELDWIVMKSLEKDRNRRYETANGFAADVQRYLNDETVQACPPSVRYRFRKFARRNKAALAIGTITAVALLVALVTLARSNVLVRRASEQKELALQEKDEAVVAAKASASVATDQLFSALLNRARTGRFGRQMGQRLDSLAALKQAAEIKFDEHLRDEAIAAMAVPDIQRGQSLHVSPPGTKQVTFDGLYHIYARLNDQGVVSVRNIPDNVEVQSFKTKSDATLIKLSPNGQFLAVYDARRAIQLWRVADGKPLLRQEPYPCVNIAYTPDSRHAAIAVADSISSVDLTSGLETHRWRLPAQVHALAYHPVERRLAVTFARHAIVSIYDSDRGTHITDLPIGLMNQPVVAWHPDGERLAVAGSDPRIQIWDVATKSRRATLEGHVEQVTALSFHSDGNLLASMSWDSVLRLWDPATGRQLMQLPIGATVQFSTTGKLGYVWQGSEWIQFLDVTPSREYRTIVSKLGAGRGRYIDGAISSDGRLLALGMGADGDRMWELSTGREVALLPGGSNCVLFQSERALLTCGDSGLHRWPIENTPSAAGEFRLGPSEKITLPFVPHRAALNPDGRSLAVVNERPGAALIMDLNKGSAGAQLLPHPVASEVAYSPDGRWVASCGWHSDRVRLWNAKTGAMWIHEWVNGTICKVYFTPDSRALIICRGDAFTFYDAETFQELRRLTREVPLYPGHVAFSPDGKLMALEMKPGVIQIMEVATWRTVAQLQDPHGDRAAWMSFTPDGTELVVVAKYAFAIHVWNLRVIREHLKEMGLDWEWDELNLAHPQMHAGERIKVEVIPGSVDQPNLTIEQRVRKAIEVDPKNVTAHATLGNILMSQGKVSEAIASYEKAIELGPKLADVHQQMGIALAGRGKLDEAIVCFRKAIELDPKFVNAYLQLGNVLSRKGRHDEAIAAYKKAIEADPKFANAHYYLGSSLSSQGKPGEAISAYKEAIRLAPRHATAANNLAWLYATCADPMFRDATLAVQFGEKAVGLRPREGLYWNTLGAAHYRAGDWKAAIEALEKSMQLRNGGDSFDWFLLAMAHWQLGNKDAARKWYDEAVAWMGKNQPTNEELRRFRAEAAEKLGIAATIETGPPPREKK